MKRRIKLIWDFRGADAGATAAHHAKHLNQYAISEALEEQITGHHKFSAMHSIAYMVVEESHLIQVRDALLPHRGEIYDGMQ